MRSIEMHTIESHEDVDLGLVSGLLELEDLNGLECSACYDAVGTVDGLFYSFVVVLDEETRWFTCTGCASDVINGDIAPVAAASIFDAEEEFDELDLLDDED